MADIESNIRFGVDTSDAIASIKLLQAQVSAFQKQMASSSAANAESARKLRRGLVDDLNATGQWSASIRTIKSSSDSFTNSLEKNKLSMGEYFRYAGSQTTAFRNLFTTEFNTIEKVARERVKDLQTQYIGLGRDANGALKSIAVRPLRLDMESLATQTAMNAQRQQIFNQLLRQGSTNLLNFGKNTQWAGRQLMVGFTIPLSIFGTMAGKTFMQLEEQAIRFKRVYGELFTPPEEADQMLETLKELGKEFTKYGVAVEKTLGLAADAAAMGKTGTELLDQVTEANRLAVLGNVEQQQALETTISITNAFGVATEDLAKKIDFLNAVENQTVVSIEDMTIAVPKAGPVVQQLGGDVEDLAFFLTAMKEGGINASEGANALKSGLASLINPTGAAANMLKVFGINVQEIVDSSRGDVRKLVVDFASALDTLDPSQRAQAIEQLFGKFQFSRLSTLFQNVIQEGTQASRVLELANATTQELAQLSEKELKRVEESTTFRFRKAIEEFQLAIAPVGEEFLKLITPIIEFATKIIEKFNSLSDGAKGFITGLTVLLGAVGPVAIMTFGLLANGVANIIKGFTFVRELFLRTGKQSTILGEQLDYMTVEQLQAAAVAASLDQVHQKLIQTFSSEAAAVQNLGNVYKQAFNEQQRFDTGRNIARAAGLRLNSGIVSVPGPKGAGDVVPAMLSPGEAVIPADAAKKYAPFIQGMIAGNIPGFAKGVFLGMPKSGKGTGKDREAADQIYSMFQNSSYANTPPRNYGHQLAKTTGHSFPIFGLGGVYMSPEGKKVFVKPVLDERSAVAEIRATQIARQAHGLKAPEQKIVVMQDPTDPKRQRRFLALESALDSTFVNNDPMGIFNEDQYFKQLVASLVRVDKDLSASNVYRDVVADVGPAGVFSRASGVRDYADSLPSMEQQAMINLLGIKGGAKKAFAESTVALMAGLTPQQYHQRMISEIQQVLPLLRQTVAGFKLTDPREVKVYSDMIGRLEQGLTVDWSKFHAIHSNVKPTKPKQTIPGYADGVVSVPGPKGAGDIVPAMLSPGEAVIPADKSKRYAGLIQAIMADKIPGFENGPGLIPKATEQINSVISKLTVSDRSFAALSRVLDNYQEVLTTVAERMLASGQKISQASIRRNEDILRVAKMAATTSAGGAAGGGSASSISGVNLAHGAPMVKLSQEIARAIGQELIAAGITNRVSNRLAGAESDVNAYGNLVFPMPRSFNAGDMTGAEASSFVRQDPSMFTSVIADMYQIDRNDPNLMQFAETVASGLESAGSRAIVDSEFYEIVANGIEQMATSAARDAMIDARNTLATIADDDRREPFYYGRGMSATTEPFVPGATSVAATSATLQTGKRSYVEFRKGAAGQELMSQANLVADQFVVELVKSLSKRISSGEISEEAADSVFRAVMTGLDANSPSGEYKKISESVSQGVKAGADDAKLAGQLIGETVADSAASTTRRGPRRASTNPETVAWLAQQQSQAAAIDTATNKRAPRRVTVPGTKELREAEQAQQRQTQATQNMTRATEEGSDNLMKMNSVIMNGTFAISSLSGVLSLFGGQFAELNQQIFGLSTALFALMQITQVLTQAKIAELLQTRLGAAFIAVRAARAFGTGAIAAKGLAGGLSRAVLWLGKFLGPVGVATTVIGGLVAVLLAVNEAEEKKKKALVGLTKTTNLAEEQLQMLADEFSVSRKKIDFATAATPSEQDSVGITPQDLAQNQEFLNKFDTQLAGIRSAAAESVSVALEGLALQLEGEGFAPEAIKTITEALVEAAGRTDVKLDFFKITATGEIELDVDVRKSAELLIENYRSAFQQSQQSSGALGEQLGNTTGQGFWPTFWSAFGTAQVGGGQAINLSAALDIDRETGKLRARTEELNSIAKIKLEELSAYFVSAFTNIRSELLSGSMSIEDYHLQLSTLFSSLASLGDEAIIPLIPQLAESMDIKEEVDAFVSDYDKVLKIKSAVANVPISDDDIKVLNKGGKEAEVVRKRINKQILDSANNLKKVVAEQKESAVIDENIGTANAQLNDRVIALQNQSAAYKILTDLGYDAATAFDLAGDSGLAAGIKAAYGAGVASTEWKDMKALIDQVISLEKAAPKSIGTGQKSKYDQTIESLKEQRDEIKNNSIAVSRLTKNGFDLATAMRAAEDPITAAAIATTKVGTQKWERLIKAIQTTQALLSKKEIQELLRGGKIEKADKQAQVTVSTALSRLGWTAEQIDKTLSDQEFTNTLAKDLGDGVIDSQQLLNRLTQIKELESLDIQLNMTTKEGAAEEFQKKYDKVVGYLEAQKQTIEVDFQIRTLSDNRIIREAEATIAALQFKIDDFEAELTGIEDQETKINETYDSRKKALDQISKANEQIQRQQKAQLSVADALSQGDIAAAARAAQELRAQKTQEGLQKQGEFLDRSREMSLDKIRSANGRTRKQIEKEIKDLKDQVFAVEEKTLEPARERIRLATLEKERSQDSLNSQILNWEKLAARVNEAKLKLTPEEMAAMEYQAGLIADLLENWNKIEDKTATLTIIKKTLGEEDSTETTTKNDGKKDGTGKNDDGTTPKAVVTPMPVAQAAEVLNAKTALNNAKAGADAAKASATLAKAAGVDIKKTTADTAERKIVNAVASASKAVAGRTADSIERAVNAAKPQTQVINPRLMKSSGGMIKKYAAGGFAMGTDIIPAMLTPGEFVVRRHAVQNFGVDRLKAINSGKYGGDSVYNYSVSVNVKSDANPDQIAKAVMTQIRQIDSQRIRSTKL